MFTQLDNDGEKFMMAYAYRVNNMTKAKYDLYEGKCVIIIWVVSSFWCYICSSPFTLVINQ
jgi:hypothetical protein